MIIDCVSAGAQMNICDVLDNAGSKMYAAVITGVDTPVSKGVTKVEINGWSIVNLQGWKAGHTGNHLVGGRRKIYATGPGEGGRTLAGAGTQGYG